MNRSMSQTIPAYPSCQAPATASRAASATSSSAAAVDKNCCRSGCAPLVCAPAPATSDANPAHGERRDQRSVGVTHGSTTHGTPFGDPGSEDA